MIARRWGGVLCAAALLASGCAHDKDGLRHDGPVVKDLQIDGAQKVKAKELKQHILTSETSWIPFTEKKRLDENVWSTDLERIERYYQSQGYYQAHVVASDVEPQDGGGAVKLHVQVKEGEPTRVAGVQVNGLDGLPENERDAVLGALGLKKGDVFVEDQWNGVQERMTSALLARGYAQAQVKTDAKVDLAQQTAALVIDVAPGQKFEIGEVQVAQNGPSRVPEWRIVEQAKEVLETYQLFTPEAQHEVQERIFDMGVFGAARVQPGQANPATGRMPMTISVVEAPYHDLAWGVGVGVEQRRNEGHLISQYTNRDFLGGLRKLTLEGRLGYAFIPNLYTATRGGDAVTRSGPVARLSAELEQPRLWHPNFKLNTRAEVERAVEPAYEYDGGKARVGVQWRPRSWFTIEPSYNVEVYSLRAGETSLTGTAPKLLFGCDQTCVLSYLEEVIAYDRRDDPQEPKQGVYLALSLQQGGGPFGGSFDYLRFVPEARGYISPFPQKRLTFAGRLKVGSLIPLSGGDRETPVVARFFSGGDEMRGFSTQRLSPMRLEAKTQAKGPYNAEPVPIGGDGLFEASFETRYQLTHSITVAGFLDTGFVTTEHAPMQPSWVADNLLYAVGTGVRYRTPVGPVRLDFAYRLPFGPPLQVYDPGDGSLSYLPSGGCFGLGKTSSERGGAPEGVCSIHLSIGEAF